MSQSHAPAGAKTRPVSPHLQVWHWHVTMLSSILHRASGIGLSVGMIFIVAWAVSLASGKACYDQFLAIAASPIGLLVWFLMSFGAFVHLAGGIRHLVWDTGRGFEPKKANYLALSSLVYAALATVALWVALFATGKVHF